jgi:predicted kinase
MRQPKVIMTKGLPGSGKTTWARAQQAADPSVVLVSKDELRTLLHGGRFSRGNEHQVVAIRDAIVADALGRGRDVIVHDTNLDPSHGIRLAEIATAYGAAFAVEDFTAVPLETCIARDADRPAPVGSTVIRTMWREFLFRPSAGGSEPSGPTP